MISPFRGVGRSTMATVVRAFGWRGQDAQVRIHHVPTFCLFFSYFRLEALFLLDNEFSGLPTSVQLIIDGLAIDSQSESRLVLDQNCLAITLEALITRESFPELAILKLTWQRKVARIPLTVLMLAAQEGSEMSLDAMFGQLIKEMSQQRSISRPRMLDIGGRARSGLERRQNWPECDVITIDIEADPSVDVVGDAHELSRHFPPASFDVAHCVSVFEHLLMPWKAALEINRVLRPGGYVLIHTHQTIGLHDLPWDFWRFSDTSWHGLFNAHTGFEIVKTSMQSFMHVVPRVWGHRYRFAERSGGFEGSTVIARKIGETALEWEVPLTAILSTNYPIGRNEAL